MVTVREIKLPVAKRMIIAAALFIGVWSYVCQAGEETVIQPGTGVGALKIGMPLDAAYRSIGQRKADIARQVEAGATREIWLTYSDMGITLVVNPDKMVERIIVTSPGLLVERNGLRIGSTVTEVEKYYGEAKKKTAIGENGELWSYPSIGISFTIDRVEKRVDVITVMGK